MVRKCEACATWRKNEYQKIVAFLYGKLHVAA